MWGPLDISPQTCVRLCFGELTIYVRRIDDEWLFSNSPSSDTASRRDWETTTVSPEELPPELDWLRLVGARNETLELVPVLPERPLVIRPESPISIFSGRYASFHIAVPIWFRFVAVRGKERIDVIDTPSRQLSNTWFGDPAGGELCYSLDSSMKRSRDQLAIDAATAVCSLVVRNGSEEKLDFERICVHVENLSVFQCGADLWTNEIKVLFKGSDQISQITIQKGPSELPDEPRLLTPPRVEPTRGVLKRSFSLIRQFTGI